MEKRYYKSIVFFSLFISILFSKINILLLGELPIPQIPLIVLETPSPVSTKARSSISKKTSLPVKSIDNIILSASKRFDVPADLLKAIARVESGRGGSMWVIHHKGKALRFKTKNDAIQYCRVQIQKGSNALNIGVMQIYWPAHRKSFSDIGHVIDPETNVMYAARFLSKLYHRSGKSWAKAVKAYHSPNPRYAEQYYGKVSRALGRSI